VVGWFTRVDRAGCTGVSRSRKAAAAAVATNGITDAFPARLRPGDDRRGREEPANRDGRRRRRVALN